MPTKKLISKIWNIVSTVIVVLIVILAIFLMGSRIIGYRVFNVISPSMEPKYSVGDLIYVKEIYREEIKTSAEREEKIARVQELVDSGELKVGDAITFVMNDSLVVGTHSIIEIDVENKCFYTKGEANDTPDGSPVLYENVIGEATFAIPLLGYFSDWVQNPPGTYIMIAVGILLILAVFLPDFFRKKEATVSEEVSEATAKERAELEKLREEIAKERAELEAQKAKDNGES